MARKKNPKPMEQDPWVLSAAAGYAFTLIHKYGHEYPEFAEIARRVQRESLRIDDLESQHMSAAAYGMAMETTIQNMHWMGRKKDRK